MSTYAYINSKRMNYLKDLEIEGVSSSLYICYSSSAFFNILLIRFNFRMQ